MPVQTSFFIQVIERRYPDNDPGNNDNERDQQVGGKWSLF